MRKKTSALAAVLLGLAIVLTGCGGREAHPVASTRATDHAIDCAAVEREYAANERQILATMEERSDAQGKNIILGVTGAVFFLPALFFMDPKSPERVEIEALRNRNGVLEDIARTKKCAPPKSQLTDIYSAMDRPASRTPGNSPS